MNEPNIAQKCPYILELEPGKYFWCSCGKSKSQPFCDDSHIGTQFKPKLVKITQREEVWLCGCKHTGNKPYCDDTHLTL